MALKKREKKEDLKSLADEIAEESKRPIPAKKDYDYTKLVSTGSTLLDLAISGNKGGGIPGGVILEIFGAAGSGKTAILSEIGANAQSKGGQVMFLDPEARLDQEYARIYGIKLHKDDYHRPDTVVEMFDYIYNWQPKDKNKINVIATDSLAALSTELEMESQDKMGMRRAKSFSEGLRKTARIIANNGWIIACSNQVRDSQYGETTPGGHAIPFYSSLRIRVNQTSKIEREVDINGKKVKKTLGIESSCYIRKSTIDDPYRECKIYIRFGYGIDDVMGNLQYLKDMTKETVYDCLDGKKYQSLEKAILYIEENNLQSVLKDKTIEIWHLIEDKFKNNRQPKVR
jgi:recombination protein RecA